jgi:putative peptide zinc metalloprotease protein
MGPTLRRLLPRHRHEPTALTGRARLLVTAWVLIVVPILFSLSLSAIILLPRLATSAWDSGQHIAGAIPHQAADGQILDVLASVVRLLALVLPVLGSCLVTQKVIRTTGGKARAWSAGQPARRAAVIAAAAAIIAALAWAWWPAGQYQPVRATDNGTLTGMVRLVSAPAAVARPTAAVAPVHLSPGTHLAVAMIPVGGATKAHPALYVIPGGKGHAPVAVLASSSPDPSKAPTRTGPGGSGLNAPPGSTSQTASPSSASTTSTTTTTTATSAPQPGAGSSTPTQANAFPFHLPAAPGPNDSQALAVNRTDGGVTYDVTYSLVTVKDGAPVTETNSAYALANCHACTTVAVSFQVVLVVGESRNIAPINAAGAMNGDCPACMTTAIADQIVVTLKSQPSQQLLDQLQQELRKLDALSALGAQGTPAAVAAQVAAVQQEIENELDASGLPAQPLNATTTASNPSSPSSGASGQTTSAGGSATTTSSSTSATPASPTSQSSPQPSSTTATTQAQTPTTTTAQPQTSTTATTTASDTATTSTTAAATTSGATATSP